MENEKIKLYIVDIEENTISRLQSLFYANSEIGIEIIGFSFNYSQCINDFSTLKNADIVLLSAYLPDTMGIELIPHIKKINPTCSILITLNENTKNLADTALKRGAHDFIQKPFKAGILLEKIDKLLFGAEVEEPLIPQPNYNETPSYNEKTDKKEPKKVTGFNDLFNTQNPFSSTMDYEEETNDKPNRVITFISTGSYGKTSLVVNSAIAINKYSPLKPRICIVDFNLLYPSVLYKFHHDDLIPSKKNIFDLFDDINDLKPQLIESACYVHEPTGIKILHSPTEVLRDYSNITPDSINQLITHLRSTFDLVLIDTSTNIKDDFTSFPITVSDKTFVVLQPDLTSILHTHKLVNLFKVFEEKLDNKIFPKLNFILNNESPKNKVDLELIKKSLANSDIKIIIPSDANMTSLSNDGKFVIDSNTASSRSIKVLASLIYPSKYEESTSTPTSHSSADALLNSVKNIFNFKKK